MITIIYGDNSAESRKFYLEEKNKSSEKITLDGASLTITDFIQAISGNGLFGDQQTIFIEELLSKRKPSKELDAIILSLTNSQSPLFLWESKELTAKQLSPFKSAQIKQFKIPSTVFSFLDSILPGNGKKSIQLFHELLENNDVNFALFMLQRHIRMLLALDSDNQQISEVKRMAPWQKGKLGKQAKAFTQEALIQLHEMLYQLELGQKTGNLSQPLVQEIDFLLISM